MKKFIILISLALFITLIKAPPGPRVDSNGVTYISTIPGWVCTVTFNSRGTPVYIAGMSDTFPYIDNANTGTPVDSISWSGTSCNCWVVVFEDTYFDDANTGFWTVGTGGSYDLTAYNFLQDSDLVDDDYSQWNTGISSYRVYCF